MDTFKGLYLVQYAWIHSRGCIWYNMHGYIQGVVFGTICMDTFKGLYLVQSFKELYGTICMDHSRGCICNMHGYIQGVVFGTMYLVQ